MSRAWRSAPFVLRHVPACLGCIRRGLPVSDVPEPLHAFPACNACWRAGGSESSSSCVLVSSTVAHCYFGMPRRACQAIRKLGLGAWIVIESMKCNLR